MRGLTPWLDEPEAGSVLPSVENLGQAPWSPNVKAVVY